MYWTTILKNLLCLAIVANSLTNDGMKSEPNGSSELDWTRSCNNALKCPLACMYSNPCSFSTRHVTSSIQLRVDKMSSFFPKYKLILRPRENFDSTISRKFDSDTHDNLISSSSTRKLCTVLSSKILLISFTSSLLIRLFNWLVGNLIRNSQRSLV